MLGEQDINLSSLIIRQQERITKVVFNIMLNAKYYQVSMKNVIHKLVSIHREDTSNTTTILENMRSGVGFYVGFDNEDVFLGNRKRPIQLNSKFSLKKQLITFPKDKNIDIDYAQTQFNTVLDNEGPGYCASFLCHLYHHARVSPWHMVRIWQKQTKNNCPHAICHHI